MNAGVWAQTDYNSSPTTNSECPDGTVEVTECQGRSAHVSLRRGASGMRKPPVVMGAHQLGLGERWPSARLSYRSLERSFSNSSVSGKNVCISANRKLLSLQPNRLRAVNTLK
jgi:hypothetical protein